MTFLCTPGAEGLSVLITNFRTNPYHNAFEKLKIFSRIVLTLGKVSKYTKVLHGMMPLYFFSMQLVGSQVIIELELPQEMLKILILEIS